MRRAPRGSTWTALALAVTLVLPACGVVYVNQADREPSFASQSSFDSSRSAEVAYRIIYTRLLECTSGYYRVGGDFDNTSKHGQITVDTGVGFQNTLFLADAHVMTIDIVPGGSAGSRVTVRQKSAEGSPLARQIEPWVNGGSASCGE